MEPCVKYRPLEGDPAFCMCQLHWNTHSQGVRHLFWDKTDKSLVDAVIAAVNRPVCSSYTPSKDWPEGDTAPFCVCGRPSRPSHQPGIILDGVRRWRDTHRSKSKTPCGHFKSSLSRPGTCAVCDNKWITHSGSTRGLIIEQYYDEHEGNCKCITMSGDVECNCLSDQEKQDALDEIGGVKSIKHPAQVTPMGCKQFDPKSVGNTYCKCGLAFHLHTTTATDGHASFLSWRAAHLSNKELIAWFMFLPGKDRAAKTDTLKRLLDDPNYEFTPPAHLVAPNFDSMLALLDALTGSHHIKSPSDIAKIESKRQAQAAPASDDEMLHYCHSCGEVRSTVQGFRCSDCEEQLATMNDIKGPALVHKAGEVLGG